MTEVVGENIQRRVKVQKRREEDQHRGDIKRAAEEEVSSSEHTTLANGDEHKRNPNPEQRPRPKRKMKQKSVERHRNKEKVPLGEHQEPKGKDAKDVKVPLPGQNGKKDDYLQTSEGDSNKREKVKRENVKSLKKAGSPKVVKKVPQAPSSSF